MNSSQKQILSIAVGRAGGSLANSFIIVLLPLYIGSTAVSLTGVADVVVFGVPLTEQFFIGVVLSLFGLLSSLVQPLTGRFSDRVAKRRVFMMAGLGILAVTTAVYPFVDAYRALLAIRGVQGVGAALTTPSTVALVSDWSDASTRGSGFGTYNTIRLVGFGVGPLAAGAIYRFGPYTTPVGLISGVDAAFTVAVFGAIFGFCIVGAFVSDAETTTNRHGPPLDRLRFSDPNGISLFNPVMVLGFCTFVVAASISMFTPLEGPIADRLGQGSVAFGAQFSARIFATVLFQVPAGWISDRYGRRQVIIAGFLMLIPSMFLQGVATTPFGLLIGRFGLGVAFATVFPISLALAGDLSPDRSGGTIAILTGAFGMGTAIGPVGAGFIYSVGSYPTPFILCALLGVVALILVTGSVYNASTLERHGQSS